jgi:TPR repeat protein
MKFAALGVVLLVWSAPGAMAQDVTECDRLAANPFDPDRVVETGPSFEALDAATAIPACRGAVANDPDNLRLRYELGRSLEAGGEADEAHALILSAAEAGYPMAMNGVGRNYVSGTGTAVDRMEAVRWYEKAAERVPSASVNIADLYSDGEPAPDDDPAVAFAWYMRAAEAGNLFATEKVGYHYAIGLGVELDYVKARQWFEAAYEMGSGNAAQNLAYLYEAALGVERDYAKSGRYYFEGIARKDMPSLDSFARYARDTHAEIWRTVETLLNERGIAAVKVDGVPDRETLIALIGMAGADEAATLAAFDTAMEDGVTARP